MDLGRLVQQLKEGDDTAGPVLVSIVGPMLTGYVGDIASDLPQVDREAAVETAIETAIRRIDRYDSSKGTFPAWVRTFVKHAVDDWRRNHPLGAPAALSAEVAVANQPSANDGAEPEDEVKPYSAALAALVLTATGPEQLLIRLRFEEGLTHAQIAARLGVSEPACRKRLQRLLASLRERAAGDSDLSRFI